MNCVTKTPLLYRFIVKTYTVIDEGLLQKKNSVQVTFIPAHPGMSQRTISSHFHFAFYIHSLSWTFDEQPVSLIPPKW